MRVGIIGHFGGEENGLDGQTVKTKILYEELEKASNWDIIIVNTYYKKRRKMRLIWDTIKCLCSTRDIIVLLSENGRRFYFPVLYFWSMIFHTRIYHDVIGGSLAIDIKKYFGMKRYVKSFQINWVETLGLKDQLAEIEIHNCEVMPNFKRLHVLQQKEIKRDFVEPYSFCMFSRVMKEKGIETAIRAIEDINEKAGRTVCTLDIYGQIDDGYKNDFKGIMEKVTQAVEYRGIVSYNQSVVTIQKYYALLFPTYWKSEGFPGTIVDAFAAGVPVIASDWNCNAEIICHKENGILYPRDGIGNLEGGILWAMQNQEEFIRFRYRCVVEAEKYQPDNYIVKMISYINQMERNAV